MGMHDIHAASYQADGKELREVIIMDRADFRSLIQDVAMTGTDFTDTGHEASHSIETDLEPGDDWMTLKVDDAGRVHDAVTQNFPPVFPAEGRDAWLAFLRSTMEAIAGIIETEEDSGPVPE